MGIKNGWLGSRFIPNVVASDKTEPFNSAPGLGVTTIGLE